MVPLMVIVTINGSREIKITTSWIYRYVQSRNYLWLTDRDSYQ